MKYQWITVIGIVFSIILAGCSPRASAAPVQPEAQTPAGPNATNLTVFAAASLTDAFTALGSQFEGEHPGVKVVFNFAGSQQLAQQIVQGAPADVFASANPAQMDVAVASGRVSADSPVTFAHNRLVVIYPANNPAGIHSLQDLERPGLRLVLAAKEVPVGGYSLKFLQKASQDPAFGTSFEADVLKNVVSYEENVRFVLAKVALGEADAGIVYTSDIVGANEAKVGQLDIPDDLNTIATYPIAPVADSAQAELAKAFIDSVLSPQGQAILAKYGFLSKP